MGKTETLQEFYQHKFRHIPEKLQQDLGHFNVFRMEDCMVDGDITVKYSRRDFYKVSLLRGDTLFHYADKTVEVKGSALVFFNPQVPYSWESLSGDYSGYFCIFKESFFTGATRSNIHDLPMMVPGGIPSYSLTKSQDKEVTQLFKKMLTEINTDYVYKYDLLRSYLTEIIHYALKMQPSETLYQHADAKSRITAVFSDLLERQFPIESPAQRFSLRSANDFAKQLSVHVNHLNRAIRDTTGKTTTTHIAERLTAEAKALLKHTNWNVSEISYALGFEEPAHFSNFFKKQTTLTPGAFRIV
ncbi:helix-turn-helix domain-containing protein [Chitinophaga arvensicola]|uniref:AraC-type DNA-binding protein n=1 Tax=Chitinophaga arvensicola TaxID=29529 RepID=A0A1I0SBG0_9BACT|nr:helix-turn-helix transcriptional regulator [Chitinophaga arvensicola]SEW54026.1 AraC-type DNA-binding protein [Chitinophaga arvensicola]